MRSGTSLLLLASTAGIVACASTAPTRTEPVPVGAGVPADTSCVPSALLLRRIAAAVDNRKDGSRVWVVYTCSDTSRVIVVSSGETAKQIADSIGGEISVYDSDRDAQMYEVAVMLGWVDQPLTDCRHFGASDWLPICGAKRFAKDLVANITLEFSLHDGRKVREDIPLDVDALFLNYAAIEKFVFPYYLRIVGLDGVTKMRQNIFNNLRNTPAIR